MKKTPETYENCNLDQFVDIIGAGLFDDETIQVTMRSEAVFTGAPYHGTETPDIDKPGATVIWNNDEIRPLAKRLIEQGQSFITSTKAGALIWQKS